MSETLESTFASFFSEPESKECCECGTTQNLSQYGSATCGSQLWICQRCRKQAKLQQRKEEEESAARIALYP
jgi:transposase-like protein